MQCDDLFQKIQSVQERKRRLQELKLTSQSIDKPDGNVYDDWINEAGNREAAAERALGKRQKPVGSQGQPTNFGQVIDSLGEEGALPVAADLIGLNKGWQDYNPAAAAEYVKVNGANVVADRINAIFTELGQSVRKSEILNAIQKNAAPFVHILSNMDRLQVYDDITRVHMADKVKELADIAEQTGLMPDIQKVKEFIQAFEVATYAHGMRNLASRRAGQLLQQLKGTRYEDVGIKLIMEEDAVAEKAAVEALAKDVTEKTDADGNPTPKELRDYIQAGEVTKDVIRAAKKGAKGAEELREIQRTILLEATDPDAGPGSNTWDNTANVMARAAYKDTILASAKSIAVNNYLSQKMIYLTQGVRQVFENRVMLGQSSPDVQMSLTEVDGDLKMVNPLDTRDNRSIFQDMYDAARNAAAADYAASLIIDEGFIATSWMGVPKQRMQSILRAVNDGFFEGKTPFAGRTDDFNTAKGQLPPSAQPEVAKAIMDMPYQGNAFSRTLQLRNKFHTAIKYFSNKYAVNPLLKKAGLPDLPVFSALQMNAAIDQRAGVRAFLVTIANEKLQELTIKYPKMSFKRRFALMMRDVDEALIRATPTQAQIGRYRKQYDLGPEISDDMIMSKLQQQNVGYPLLDNDLAVKAQKESVAQRMQQKPEGMAGKIDSVVQNARQYDEFESTVASFWRAPFNGLMWNLGFSADTMTLGINKAIKLGYNKMRGQATPKMVAEAQAATMMSLGMWGTFVGLKQFENGIIGNGPIDKERRKVWEENLRQRGLKPNSILGVQLPGVPIAHTLFLMNDIVDMAGNQWNNGLDTNDLMWDGISLLANQVMTMPGFFQMKFLLDAISDPNPRKAIGVVASYLNSWFNPVNGGMRDAQRLGGINRDSLVVPPAPFLQKDGELLLQELGPDAPQNQVFAAMQRAAYESAPGLAHWGLGVPVFEYTYLGRERRTPPGVTAWQMMTGQQGIRDGESSWFVENQLEYLGQLRPPSVQMNGMLESVPVSTDLIKEHNYQMGHVVSQRGFGRDAQSPTGMSYTVPRLLKNGKQVTESVSVTKLMNRLTKGNTLREALNEFFKDPVYKELQANPASSSDPAVVRISDQDRAQRPAHRIIQRLHSYYEDLATAQIAASDSEAAQRWQRGRQRLAAGDSMTRSDLRELRQTLR